VATDRNGTTSSLNGRRPGMAEPRHHVATAPAPHQVEVPDYPLARLAPVIGATRWSQLQHAAQRTRDVLSGARLWNINSTASGGGVAEMLEVLVGYIRDADIDGRWLVISADPAFFDITKRVHNRIHGVAGDDGTLGPMEAGHYRAILDANANALERHIRRGDVVFLHDPQTAGLASRLVDAGALVVWRCHIGSDSSNRYTEEAWEFLGPFLSKCHAFVFSRREYVPAFMASEQVRVIPPSIDPFSPKNQRLTPRAVAGVLGAVGLVHSPTRRGAWHFTRRDGSQGVVSRHATIVADAPLLTMTDRTVVQVSRWDGLKDMVGVMQGFTSGVSDRVDAQLLLVGPQVDGVGDDPQGSEVFAQCVTTWERLPERHRRRVRLVALPTTDTDENAAMVNAIQRHAAVVVQKSLAEGFGLTVSEAMWKSRPVVASAVGGIVDQVTSSTGILLDDPHDLEKFGDLVAGLLERPDEAAVIGRRARRRVHEHFLDDRHLMHFAKLIEEIETS
jgi:trehalose synthase